MKPLMTLMLLGVLAVTVYAADTDKDSESAENRYFVFLLTPGPTWDHDRPIFEQDWGAHITYMQTLVAGNQLVLGGPFKDDSGAFGILKAESIEQARELAEADPAVTNNLVEVEVRPWHPVVIKPMQRKPW